MPRIARDQKLVESTPQEILAGKIKAGKAVPLLSSVVEHDLILRGQEALVKYCAEKLGYPLADMNDLPRIMQFCSVTRSTTENQICKNYLNAIKNQLCDIAEDDDVSQETLTEIIPQFDQLDFTQMAKILGYPHFDDVQHDPLLLLASLDLPI